MIGQLFEALRGGDPVALARVDFVVSVGCLLFLLLAYRLKPKQGPHRAIRNHLRKWVYVHAWLLGYYFVLLGIQYSSVAPIRGVYEPWYLTLATIVVLFARNVNLRSAVNDLLAPLDQGPPINRSPALTHLARFFTDEGILYSSALSLVALLVSSAVPDLKTPVLITIYGVMLAVTTALCLRVANAYWRLGVRKVEIFCVVLYGLWQLPYVGRYIVEPVLWNTAYEIPLLVLKLFATIAVILACRTISRTSSYDIIADLVLKGRAEGELRKLAQILVVVILFGLTIYASVTILGRWGLIGLPAVVLVGLVLQLTSSQVAGGLAYRIKWTRLAHGPLLDRVVVKTKRDQKHWRVTTICRPNAPSNGVQVVLIHGLFSSGEGCWGLLPLHLCEEPDVSSVKLVDYSHWLWTSGNTFGAIESEVALVLERTLKAHRGETIMVGHSLGALLALKVVAGWQLHQSDHIARLRRIVLVNPPVMGSAFATLLVPTFWFRLLKFGSGWIRDRKRDLDHVYPPINSIIGEENHSQLSWFVSTRDGVANTIQAVTSLPGSVVAVAGWEHSLANGLMAADSDMVEKFKETLVKYPRASLLMEVIAGTMKGHAGGWALTFTTDGSDLRKASVRRTDPAWWGHRISDKPDQDSEPLAAAIHGRLPSPAAVTIQQIEAMLLTASNNPRNPTFLDLGGAGRPVIFWGRDAGFVMLAESGWFSHQTPAVVRPGQGLIAF